jgi:hypothetical protein
MLSNFQQITYPQTRPKSGKIEGMKFYFTKFRINQKKVKKSLPHYEFLKKGRHFEERKFHREPWRFLPRPRN